MRKTFVGSYKDKPDNADLDLLVRLDETWGEQSIVTRDMIKERLAKEKKALGVKPGDTREIEQPRSIADTVKLRKLVADHSDVNLFAYYFDTNQQRQVLKSARDYVSASDLAPSELERLAQETKEVYLLFPKNENLLFIPHARTLIGAAPDSHGKSDFVYAKLIWFDQPEKQGREMPSSLTFTSSIANLAEVVGFFREPGRIYEMACNVLPNTFDKHYRELRVLTGLMFESPELYGLIKLNFEVDSSEYQDALEFMEDNPGNPEPNLDLSQIKVEKINGEPEAVQSLIDFLDESDTSDEPAPEPSSAAPVIPVANPDSPLSKARQLAKLLEADESIEAAVYGAFFGMEASVHPILEPNDGLSSEFYLFASSDTEVLRLFDSENSESLEDGIAKVCTQELKESNFVKAVWLDRKDNDSRPENLQYSSFSISIPRTRLSVYQDIVNTPLLALIFNELVSESFKPHSNPVLIDTDLTKALIKYKPSDDETTISKIVDDAPKVLDPTESRRLRVFEYWSKYGDYNKKCRDLASILRNDSRASGAVYGSFGTDELGLKAVFGSELFGKNFVLDLTKSDSEYTELFTSEERSKGNESVARIYVGNVGKGVYLKAVWTDRSKEDTRPADLQYSSFTIRLPADRIHEYRMLASDPELMLLVFREFVKENEGLNKTNIKFNINSDTPISYEQGAKERIEDILNQSADSVEVEDDSKLDNFRRHSKPVPVKIDKDCAPPWFSGDILNKPYVGFVIYQQGEITHVSSSQRTSDYFEALLNDPLAAIANRVDDYLSMFEEEINSKSLVPGCAKVKVGRPETGGAYVKVCWHDPKSEPSTSDHSSISVYFPEERKGELVSILHDPGCLVYLYHRLTGTNPKPAGSENLTDSDCTSGLHDLDNIMDF